MNIKDICIGDSQINEYSLKNQTLTMILQDYTENLFEIVMNECSFIHVKGSVGFSLSKGKFTKDDGDDFWLFYDEDGAIMEIHFKGYVIKKLQSSD